MRSLLLNPPDRWLKRLPWSIFPSFSLLLITTLAPSLPHSLTLLPSHSLTPNASGDATRTHHSTTPSLHHSSTFIRPPTSCPTAIEPLTALMLRDIPNYGNRVSQRSRRSVQDSAPQSHILTASDAEIATLEPGFYNIIPSREELEAQGIESIFFTTLERQSLQNDWVFLQHYHWAFLVETSQGWKLVFMYSILGDYPATDPPSPPRESNDGVMAQAIRLWLRDCEAGAIEPPAMPLES